MRTNLTAGSAISTMLYIVQGIDPAGRKFRGLYSKEDAIALHKSNPRLNIIIDRETLQVVQSDNI